MDYLPVFIDVRGRRCLVVGGGTVAARKVATLRAAGARVCVVGLRFAAAFDAWRADTAVSLHARGFAPADVEGCALVVAATDSHGINRQVADAAGERGVPVNVVDTPALCSFVMPSVVDRSPVIAAISTAGTAPVLARLLRADMESLLPPSTATLAALTGEYRERVKDRFADPDARRRFWERMLRGEMAECVYRGDDLAAREVLERSLAAGEDADHLAGVVRVIEVAAAPDLLSLRALRYLQEAEIVAHHDEVDPRVVALARRDAERVTLPDLGTPAATAAVVDALATRAQPGHRVVWLCDRQAATETVVAVIDTLLARGVEVTRGPVLAPA